MPAESECMGNGQLLIAVVYPVSISVDRGIYEGLWDKISDFSSGTTKARDMMNLGMLCH